MAIPFGPGNSPPNTYVVQFTFPKVDSIISEGKTALMIPNADYLVEFIGGNIGIADSMFQSTMFKNLNSPIASSDEMVFRSFANTNKIDLDDDISKYRNSSGKLSFPKEEIKINPESDLVGLKALEVTTLKSIFETQKPYIEIAKLVIGNLAKLEDITARVMPLLGIPLSTKSKKPKGNPEAVGYQSGAELKKELARIKSVQKKGGETKLGSDGQPLNQNQSQNQNSSTNTNNGNNGDEGLLNNEDWQIISTVYSTGQFDPTVEYNYKYIDLPADDDLTDETSDLNLDEETDPYKKYKPKTIILGVFDSNGSPLNPTSKIKAFDNQGNKVNTNFNKADWLLRSPKWVFPEGTIQWPRFGSPTYLRDGEDNVIYYTNGEKNILDRDVDAIPGTPKITGFSSVDQTEYRNFFNDLIGIKMIDNDEITQQERNQISSEISGLLNVQAHLQNVFLYGQSKSSVYQRLGIPSSYLQQNGLNSLDDPFPRGIKNSLKPYRIYSNEAAADEKLKAYVRSKGKPESDAGWIWIDPESDYVTKVIRVDPTTRISYKYGEGEPDVQSEIKAFTKNLTVFGFSDGREFNAEVFRSTQGTTDFTEFTIEENITSYNLENWNYIDNDGIISQFGVVNEEPELSNTNSYKITLWGTTPTPYYNTGENLYASTQVSSTYLKVDEVKKEGDNWKLTKLEYDISNLSNDILDLSNATISEIYLSYKSNPSYQYTYTQDGITRTISASVYFSNASDVTEDGKQRLADKSLVEVENGIITRWYYMTPNDDTDDYTNGLWNSGLPNNGTKRTITIDVDTIGNDNQNPIDSSVDETIPQFQIRVRDDDSRGRVIDPSKILNEQLTTSRPFSSGKYGYGDNQNKQEIDVINRYMLTELDTESYYIIEGVLPELVDNEGRYIGDESSTSSSSGGSGTDDGYYKLPDAIGAIKVFISVLGDIFGKLIPTITKTISLFKNPASFVTQIISEQMKEGFLFATPDALSAFKEALDLKKNIPSPDIDQGRERKRAVKNLENFFKNSSLSNFVYVRDDGNFNSVLDGVAGIPFSIFGANIPFGMELDMSKVPSPLNLSFPSNINFKKTKNLQSFINPKSFDDTNASNLFSQINDASPSPKLDNKYPFSNLDGIDRTGEGSEDKTKIEFQDGSSIFIPDNSLDEFIISNETKYNFIYVEETTQSKIEEATNLIESGTEENLSKALDILDDVSKRIPNNSEIDNLKQIAKGGLDGIKAGQQPLLKMILGLVTLPIKIIGGIIEWIMNFFKKLSNPLKLPSLIAELLSFQWVMQFFTPKGLLEMAGIKFKPEKIAEWAALSKLPTIPDDVDLADLSEFLNVAFNVKLPTYTKGQYSEIDPRMPLRFITSLFCFIENLINGIIDFIWATLGIEAVIPPPHIKLCSDTDLSTMNPEDISKVLNGEIPGGKGDGSDVNNKGESDDFEGFYYEVELPDGTIKRFLDREQLDKFVEDNKDINYDFTF